MARATSPIEAMWSMSTGSSTHIGESGSSARAILIACGRLHSECSSAATCMRSPTALRIFSNGSMACLRSAAEIQ